MNKLQHLTNIHEAANQLHKLLLGLPWYIRTQVFSTSPPTGPVLNKHETQEIIVYVKNLDATKQTQTIFNSWPVRYKLGAETM